MKVYNMMAIHAASFALQKISDIMKKILNIISSPRGEASFSNKLGNALIDKLRSEYPGASLTTRDLNKLSVPHFHAEHIDAFFTPKDNHTDTHKQSTKLSDELIAELFDADIIVINVPTYNLSIPSALKAWIDQITRSGHTFKYGEHGPQGLVTGKQAYVAVASGGVFSEGPFKGYDFVAPYLKTVLGFIGITDTTVLRVEGVSVPALSATALSKAIQSIDELQLVA